MDTEPAEHDDAFPRCGRLAGVDYGTVRIGISVCDPLRILVSPLEIRQVGGHASDAEYFRSLAQREGILGFVVGLPIHCDGGESEKSRQSREFARWLWSATAVPVRLFDERFTTSDAQSRVRRGAGGKRTRQRQIDAVAAQILLESFLEAARYAGRLPGQPIGAPPGGEESLD